MPAAQISDAEGRKELAAGMLLNAEGLLAQARQHYDHDALEELKVAVANGKPELSPSIDATPGSPLYDAMRMYIGDYKPIAEFSSLHARGELTRLDTVGALQNFLTQGAPAEPQADAIGFGGPQPRSDVSLLNLAMGREALRHENQMPANLRLKELKATSDAVLEPLKKGTAGMRVLTFSLGVASGVAAVFGGGLVACGLGVVTLGSAYVLHKLGAAEKTEQRLNRVLNDVIQAATGDNESGLVNWLTSHWHAPQSERGGLWGSLKSLVRS